VFIPNGAHLAPVIPRDLLDFQVFGHAHRQELLAQVIQQLGELLLGPPGIRRRHPRFPESPRRGDAHDRLHVRQIAEKLERIAVTGAPVHGPRRYAGKHASRQNAVTHGLLAKAVRGSTGGGLPGGPEEFAQLLDDLREQFLPVGVAEDLEVQEIARYYWRKMRAVRL